MWGLPWLGMWEYVNAAFGSNAQRRKRSFLVMYHYSFRVQVLESMIRLSFDRFSCTLLGFSEYWWRLLRLRLASRTPTRPQRMPPFRMMCSAGRLRTVLVLYFMFPYFFGQVGEVKAIVAATKSLPLEGMKLIFSGAVLTDTQTLESIGVKETDFLVCVAKKQVRAHAALPGLVCHRVTSVFSFTKT